MDSDFRSIVTENSAVVMILDWYMTWNVAASRLDSATKMRLFCSAYSAAGTIVRSDVTSRWRTIFQLAVGRHDERPSELSRTTIANDSASLSTSATTTVVLARYAGDGGIRENRMSSACAEF